MLTEVPYAILLAGAVVLSLYLANVFLDYGAPQYVTRKIPHFASGFAFLLAPFFFITDFWPLVLTGGFALLLLMARQLNPHFIRGTGGSGRPNAIAEVDFPLSAVVIILFCWGTLGKPWLAMTPLMFVGFGDGVTGVIRNAVYNKEVKGNWGSLGMLATCLLLAVFIKPYWLGAIGAAVATLAEKYTKTSQWWDDNASIPLLSGLVMGILYHVGGG